MAHSPLPIPGILSPSSRESTEVSIDGEYGRIQLDSRIENEHGSQHRAIAIRLIVALKEHDRDVLLLFGEVEEEGDEVEEGAGCV